MKAVCALAVLTISVREYCISDILKIAHNATPAAKAIEGIAKDGHGDDRNKCEADVTALLESLDNAVTDISGSATSGVFNLLVFY